MNLSKYILGGAVALVAGAGFSSCSDSFIEEKLPAKYDTGYFTTEQGIIDATNSLYAHIRWWFGYESNGFHQLLAGTDEFTGGADLCNEMWITYDSRLAPVTATVNGNTATANGVWDEMYYGIATANMIISSGDKVSSEKTRNHCLAQAYLLRGFNFYMLTSQYGHCVLQTKGTAGIQRYFENSTPEQCWEQIISDFRTAYDLFDGEDYGTMGPGVGWTKATAAHFLAKALLFAASERNDSWNSSKKQSYLQEGLEAANYAITARKLENNVTDLYGNWTGVDCAIEKSNEILMAIPCGEKALNGRTTTRQVGCFFNTQFSNWDQRGLGGYRGQITGGKDFQRFVPTEYYYSAYDHVNDARLWKSVKTVVGVAQNYNFATSNEFEAAAANHLGAPGLKIGEIGTVFILNTADNHAYDKFTFGAARYQKNNFTDEAGKIPVRNQERTGHSTFMDAGTPVYNAWICYKDGKYVGNTFGSLVKGTFMTGSNMYACLTKHNAPANDKIDGDNSQRNITLARLAETYLVRAEIKIRTNDYTGAKADIDVLRKRGAWHEGENRSYFVDGAMTSPSDQYVVAKNWVANAEGYNVGITSYYLSNPDVAETTASTEAAMTNWTWEKLPAEDEAILAKVGANGQFERALNFILNEQTRELGGEFVRWETLSRTNMLGKRTKALNPDVLQFKEGRSELRPIPQTFIDQLQNADGTNLSDADKAAWQNPGY